MHKIAKDFTTGQVANVCGVSVRTVNNWINKGLLHAYKLPGTRGDHRVHLSEVVAFMQKSGMELPRELNAGEKTMLLVDDDFSMLSALSRVLRPLGKRIVTVNNSFAAGQAYAEYVPQLMTLDIHMPGLNGLELLKNMRQAGVTCKMLVISGADNHWLQKAKAAGADAVISKPFNPAELLVVAERLLQL